MHGTIPHTGRYRAGFLHHCSEERTCTICQFNSYVTFLTGTSIDPSVLHAASLPQHATRFSPQAHCKGPIPKHMLTATNINLGLVKLARVLGWGPRVWHNWCHRRRANNILLDIRTRPGQGWGSSTGPCHCASVCIWLSAARGPQKSPRPGPGGATGRREKETQTEARSPSRPVERFLCLKRLYKC